MKGASRRTGLPSISKKHEMTSSALSSPTAHLGISPGSSRVAHPKGMFAWQPLTRFLPEPRNAKPAAPLGVNREGWTRARRRIWRRGMAEGTALRIARVPKDDFERAVESDRPP